MRSHSYLRAGGREPAADEYLLAATAQKLRKMAKLIPAQTPPRHLSGPGPLIVSPRDIHEPAFATLRARLLQRNLPLSGHELRGCANMAIYQCFFFSWGRVSF